jgi:hypothetical protein
MKLLTFEINKYKVVFVTGRPFQPRLMLVTAPWVRPGAYPRVDHLKGSLTTIRLGWKGLPETNTLAYHKNSIITDVKSLITLAEVSMLLIYLLRHVQDKL